jgi:predicted naringenin-chalcone synthase
MSVYIHTISTWIPEYKQTREDASERMGGQFEDRRLQRIIRHLIKQSGIDTRHTCVPFDGTHDLFGAGENGAWRNPPTGERNQVFQQVSRKASVQLAEQTLRQTSFQSEDITHVITASCTGFYNPGPDFDIIQGLGLSPSVQRFHLGFMGCYAAFPALRLAKSLCEADPGAVVLIQCLELCSLHCQPDSDDPDTLVSSTLFADGAGCAIVSARSPESEQRALRIDQLGSSLTSTGQEAMAWDIGNHGFDIVLSSYVPSILGDNIRDAVVPFLGKAGAGLSDIRNWAVHPGGKAILERIGEALELPGDALDRSKEILRTHGNMSSATLFFVLRDLLESTDEGACAAMAFGPGLTVELGLLEPVCGGQAA